MPPLYLRHIWLSEEIALPSLAHSVLFSKLNNPRILKNLTFFHIPFLFPWILDNKGLIKTVNIKSKSQINLASIDNSRTRSIIKGR